MSSGHGVVDRVECDMVGGSCEGDFEEEEEIILMFSYRAVVV